MRVGNTGRGKGNVGGKWERLGGKWEGDPVQTDWLESEATTCEMQRELAEKMTFQNPFRSETLPSNCLGFGRENILNNS